jgi:hypothetical protein
MRLTDQEKAMRDGAEGAAVAAVMDLLIRYGEALGRGHPCDVRNVATSMTQPSPTKARLVREGGAACPDRGPALTRCAGGGAGIPAGATDEPYPHRAKHAFHPGAHVVCGDHPDLVLTQEPGYPGMVGTLGSLVVQRSPANSEFLPAANLPVGQIGDRDPVGPSPAWIDLAVLRDRHANTHP